MEKTQEIKAAGHGISMAHMTKEKFEQLPLALPPLNEQSRIVAKVDELMALCDRLETQQQSCRQLQTALRRATLQALASTTSPAELHTAWTRLADNFDHLFSAPEDVNDLRQCVKQLAIKGGLTKQSPEENTSEVVVLKSESAQAISDSEADWPIPETWCWARCAWLGESRLGKMLDVSKNKGELRPYLRNINVRWRRFDLRDVLSMRVEEQELPRITIKRGDLVICEGGEPGRAAIWNRDDEFVIQKALHRFRCGPDVLSEYLLLCLEHDFFSGRLARYYTGATIKHLTGRSLSEYPIPLPPLGEQHRIITRVSELMRLCDDIEKQLRDANNLAERLATASVAALTGIAIDSTQEEPMKAPKTELFAPLHLGKSPSVKEQAPLAAILAHTQGGLNAKDLWRRYGGEAGRSRYVGD